MNKEEIICKCGDANPKGNISFTFKGGCRQNVTIENGYRCTGCNGWFHKECIFKHFDLEKDHDWGRKEERKVIIDKLATEIMGIIDEFGDNPKETLSIIGERLDLYMATPEQQRNYHENHDY